MTKRMRLDKLLSHLGTASRAEAKKLARQGRVLVNGKPAPDVAMKIDPERDEVTVDGIRQEYMEHLYVMMNKPAGVITATEDARQKTVLDLLDPKTRAWNPFPVGRLDKDTEGLLLLTTDGALAHRLLSPRRHVPKTYVARVEGEVTEADADAFASGVRLDDGYVTMPAGLKIRRVERTERGTYSDVELTIHEGKFHQVKRMFLAVGKRVIRLKRIRMGPLELDPSLAPGTWRLLTEDETAVLAQADRGKPALDAGDAAAAAESMDDGKRTTGREIDGEKRWENSN